MVSSGVDLSSSQLDARVLAGASPAALAHVTTQGRWVPYEHLLVVDDYLLRVAAREITRLIIELPIRHGKSELVSRYTPAWWLGRYPDDQVMLACYEANFARSWGRKARDVLVEYGEQIFGIQVADSPAASDWWMVQDHEGVMVTAGVGGALTGKGADLLIIDDPVKNAEEAGSQVYRDKAWDWWQSTARSRLQPGGRVVVVMARWHEDDLAGRLQANDAEEWTVVRLPALAEDDDAMGRQPGEALCPEMFDTEALHRTKRELGSYWFAALLQQSPAPPEGLMFKKQHFRYWTSEWQDDAQFYVLHGEQVKRYDVGQCVHFQVVDVAASAKQTADYTVCSTWARTPASDLVLVDIKRQRFEIGEVATFLAGCNQEHGHPPMWVESFGHGTGPVQQLRKDGLPVRSLGHQHGAQLEKVARAQNAIAAYERHAIYHPREPLFDLDAFESELLGFNTAVHDDQVDVTAYAARLLATVGKPLVTKAREDLPKLLSAGVRSVQF